VLLEENSGTFETPPKNEEGNLKNIQILVKSIGKRAMNNMYIEAHHNLCASASMYLHCCAG